MYRRFQKYKNVHISTPFRPLIGDVHYLLKDMREGKAHYTHRIKMGKILKDYDLRLRFEGTTPTISCVSNESCEEFIKLQPRYIDREDIKRGLSKAAKHTLINGRSSKNIMNRRKLLTSELSLNHASRFIPSMVDCTIDVINDMKKGEKNDFYYYSNILTFNVFTSVLFGEDMKELANKCRPYQNPDGTVEEIPLREFMLKLFKCYYAQLNHPLTNMCRYISDYNLVNPFKRDAANHDTYLGGMWELYSKAKDPSSVCSHILENKEISDKDKMYDINAFILAGSETSSHGIVSTLFLLKKFPQTFQKLKDELTENGITGEYIREGKLKMDDLQNLDYLNCVVKESLRCDNPATDVFAYKALEDVTICGVEIPKGMLFRNEIHGTHYNDKYWYKPELFEPDRFNFESDFFKEAKKAGKTGQTYARRGFGVGLRNCPGQTLAYLEIKVAVIALITLMEYSIDEELLKQDGAFFGIGSEVPADFMVVNK